MPARGHAGEMCQVYLSQGETEMKLQITEDEELRREVKALIMGQVQRILRDEKTLKELIQQCINERIEKALANADSRVIEGIENVLWETKGTGWHYEKRPQEWIKNLATESIAKFLASQYTFKVEEKPK